jgi:hypothetical protein
MFQHYFELIEGVEIYPIFSLIVFVIFFAIVTVWSLKADKSYLREMEMLPLEDEK